MVLSTALSCSDIPVEPTKGGKVSIAHLKALCSGNDYRIMHDYSISGTVVANDWLGEMYKSIVVADDTAGIEIAIDSNNIASWLPIYSKITIFCNGLMLSRIGGKIELGAPPTQEFKIDNIEEHIAKRIITIEGADSDYTPAKRSITEIGVGDISNVAWLDGVRIIANEQGLSWCDTEDGRPTTTIRTIEDSDGNRLDIRTLGTCQYANERVPSGEFSVVGIIDYSGGRYTLRIINKLIL